MDEASALVRALWCEAMCIVCHEFPAYVHASLYVFRQKSLDVYVTYLCPKRVQKLRLYENQRQHV